VETPVIGSQSAVSSGIFVLAPVEQKALALVRPDYYAWFALSKKKTRRWAGFPDQWGRSW
jgi:hypothetical protein